MLLPKGPVRRDRVSSNSVTSLLGRLNDVIGGRAYYTGNALQDRLVDSPN